MLVFWIIFTLLAFGKEKLDRYQQIIDMDNDPYSLIKTQRYCTMHNSNYELEWNKAELRRSRDWVKRSKEETAIYLKVIGAGESLKSKENAIEFVDKYWDC